MPKMKQKCTRPPLMEEITAALREGEPNSFTFYSSDSNSSIFLISNEGQEMADLSLHHPGMITQYKSINQLQYIYI